VLGLDAAHARPAGDPAQDKDLIVPHGLDLQELDREALEHLVPVQEIADKRVATVHHPDVVRCAFDRPVINVVVDDVRQILEGGRPEASDHLGGLGHR
jgi:hypothetical protein